MTGCYCTALRRATRRLTAAYDAALAPLGITVAQFGLLRMLRRRGRISLSELGRTAELDRSTIGRNVKVLERQGLVALAPGEDARETTIALTPAGAATLDAAVEPWDGVQAGIEGRLGPDRAAALRDLLAVL